MTNTELPSSTPASLEMPDDSVPYTGSIFEPDPTTGRLRKIQTDTQVESESFPVLDDSPDADAEPDDTNTLDDPADKKERPTMKESINRARRFFHKVGRNALIPIKVIHQTDNKTLLHYSAHKVQDGIRNGAEAINNSVAKQYNIAKENLGDRMIQFGHLLLERRAAAEKRKRNRYIEHRAKNVARSIDQDEVTKRTAAILDYLKEKHPPKPRTPAM